MSNETAPEWGFTESPENVDFERIYSELSGLVAIQAYAYIGAMKRHAPNTYAALARWAKARGVMTWCKWETSDAKA